MRRKLLGRAEGPGLGWAAVSGNAPARTDSRGFVISDDRLWTRWRRKRDGAGAAPGAAPRALKDLLKQVENATQVRRSGLDQVLAELKLHRDATTEPERRSALAWLCNSVARCAHSPSAPHAGEVLLAAAAVRRAPAG
jgi:hypothetical protein